MSTAAELKKELSALVAEQTDLLKLTEDTEHTIEFGTKYQSWYTRGTKIVEALAPERLNEFTAYYLPDPKRKQIDIVTYRIQDFVRGIGPRPDPFTRDTPYDQKQIVSICVINQTQILSALASRIDSVLMDVTGHLMAELQDQELGAASTLLAVSVRAAGALAGVVLERHLQRVAVNHGVIIKKAAPTIADLSDPLKVKGVYDVPVWRKIQYLADIRNLCSHQKTKDPTKSEVEELIAGVNSIIKTVF